MLAELISTQRLSEHLLIIAPFIFARAYEPTKLTRGHARFQNFKNVPFWLACSKQVPSSLDEISGMKREISKHQKLEDYRSLPQIRLTKSVMAFDAWPIITGDDNVIVSCDLTELKIERPETDGILSGFLWTVVSRDIADAIQRKASNDQK